MSDERHINKSGLGLGALVPLAAESASVDASEPHPNVVVIFEDISGIHSEPEPEPVTKRGRGRPRRPKFNTAIYLPGIRKFARAMPDAKLETVVRAFVTDMEARGLRRGQSPRATVKRIARGVRSLGCMRKPQL